MMPRLGPSAQGAPGDLPWVPWVRLSRWYLGSVHGPPGSAFPGGTWGPPMGPRGPPRGSGEMNKMKKMKKMKKTKKMKEMKNKMKNNEKNEKFSRKMKK